MFPALLLLFFLLKFASYDHYFQVQKKRVEEEDEIEFKSQEIYTRESYFINPPRNNSYSAGEERFKEFENLLENGTGWKRATFQREFHDKATMVLAPNIIGDDWDVIGPILSILHFYYNHNFEY
jgi:hypothetical protein